MGVERRDNALSYTGNRWYSVDILIDWGDGRFSPDGSYIDPETIPQDI